MFIIKILIITIIAFSGCTTGPDARGIEVTDIYKIYNQDKARMILEGLVEEEYKIRIDNVFENSTVYWTDTICPYSDNYAVVYEGRCHFGRMWSCQEQYVAINGKGNTCGTALLHEHAHCLLMTMFNGYDDADHTDDIIWGIVEEAQEIACNRGW
jgi:hypothetical protein